MPGQLDSEAAVPFATAAATHLYMPYDFTTGYSTGFAIANPNATQAAITFSIVDDAGNHLGTTPLLFPAHGHFSGVLANAFAGTRGTLSFTSDLPLFGLGIRANGTAFTSLKVITK